MSALTKLVQDTRPYNTVVLDSAHPAHPGQTHRHAVLRKNGQQSVSSQFSPHLPSPAVHSVEVEAGHEESHVPVGGVRVRPGVDLLLVLTETVQQWLSVALKQSELSGHTSDL